jgi:ribosomal subunit interface protein
MEYANVHDIYFGIGVVNMNKRITFRSMTHSDLIEQHANKQLAKIEDFLLNERTPVYIDLILEPSKTREHNKVELRVKSPHYELYSTYEGPDLYAIIDRVIDVMYYDLHKEKQKEVDMRKQRGRHEEFKKQR